MLILSRKSNERIIIKKDITVTVLGIRGNQVRIGIDAPRDIDIHRQEVRDAILAQQDPKHTLA